MLIACSTDAKCDVKETGADQWGPLSAYLLKLRRAERVAELLAALGQRLSAGQVGHQPLLHLGVGQDGSHDVGRQDAGQVHYREETSSQSFSHSQKTAKVHGA